MSGARNAEAAYESGFKLCPVCNTTRPIAKLDENGACKDDWHTRLAEVKRNLDKIAPPEAP